MRKDDIIPVTALLCFHNAVHISTKKKKITAKTECGPLSNNRKEGGKFRLKIVSLNTLLLFSFPFFLFFGQVYIC